MLQSDIGLDWSSYLVMGLYLVAMIGLGSWFGRGKVDTETYLLGGRCMPWWASKPSQTYPVTISGRYQKPRPKRDFGKIDF